MNDRKAFDVEPITYHLSDAEPLGDDVYPEDDQYEDVNEDDLEGEPEGDFSDDLDDEEAELIETELIEDDLHDDQNRQDQL